jgi:uncharacterized protein (TIGR02246 family)
MGKTMSNASLEVLPVESSASIFLEDVQRIQGVIARFEQIWNTHRMMDLAALFTEDAEFVNAVGKRLRGRPEIVKAHQSYHATIFRHIDIHQISLDVRAIAQDVVIATQMLKIGDRRSSDDSSSESIKHRMTFVLVKKDGSWLITGGSHTTSHFD